MSLVLVAFRSPMGNGKVPDPGVNARSLRSADSLSRSVSSAACPTSFRPHDATGPRWGGVPSGPAVQFSSFVANIFRRVRDPEFLSRNLFNANSLQELSWKEDC